MGKGQSERLSDQHTESHGVSGIFGDEAQQHDKKVSECSKIALDLLKEEFPMLKFQRRVSLSKKRINEALSKVDNCLGQTLYVKGSRIQPDGGIIEVEDDHGNWRVVLVSEAKVQGKDIENIKQGISVGKKKDQDLMQAGNAVERTYKNIAEMSNYMLQESHFPYVVFLGGSNFLTHDVVVERPDGRKVTLSHERGYTNRMDKLTAANYGMPMNTNLCKNRVVTTGNTSTMLQAASIYVLGDGGKWKSDDMIQIMLDIARTSLKVLAEDLFDQLATQQ